MLESQLFNGATNLFADAQFFKCLQGINVIIRCKITENKWVLGIFIVIFIIFATKKVAPMLFLTGGDKDDRPMNWHKRKGRKADD